MVFTSGVVGCLSSGGSGGTLAAMGTEDLRHRLASTAEHLDRARRQARYQGLDVVPIDAAEARVPIRIGGEVLGVEVVAGAGSPSLEVTIADGSGNAVAVFSGCRSKGGVEPGRGILLEGVGRRERGRLVLLNPGYTLLPG